MVDGTCMPPGTVTNKDNKREQKLACIQRGFEFNFFPLLAVQLYRRVVARVLGVKFE